MFLAFKYFLIRTNLFEIDWKMRRKKKSEEDEKGKRWGNGEDWSENGRMGG